MRSAFFLFLLMSYFSVSTGFCYDMSEYRYHPFQFIYPEYNYKAPVTEVKKNINQCKNLTKINFFGLNSCVPSKYAGSVRVINKNKIVIKSEKNIIVMTKEEELMSGCNDSEVAARNKDFCSAFSSTEDLNYKLFTLTADEVKIMSNPPPAVGMLWIIHQKGILFQNTEKIHIYKGDSFTAFVQTRKDTEQNKISKDIEIFHNNIKPDHISMVTDIKDKDFLITFLSTIEPEK